jgi:hypothetical protein
MPKLGPKVLFERKKEKKEKGLLVPILGPLFLKSSTFTIPK